MKAVEGIIQQCMVKDIRFVSKRLENIVAKEGNAGFHIFSFCHDVFKRLHHDL